jgi:cytoskeletal protein CcmA (bactofilin family)
MGAEPGVGKLRVETNGNGNGPSAVVEEAPEETTALVVQPVANGSPAPPPEVQARPAPASAPAAAVELSVLARGDSGSGRWIIGGDGEVLGEFSGEIECGGSLLIGRGADVTATIRGNHVTVAGLVRGNIMALGRLKIDSTGRLEGDARVGALIVEEGGVHHGVIRVHPEGVPDIDEPVAEAAPAAEAATAQKTPVDRVKKFWGEFF